MGNREDDDYWNNKYDQEWYAEDGECDDDDCACHEEDDEAEDSEALITMMEIIDG